MNKEKEILKVSNYDDFKCIADKCRFTCCSGWDIDIDTDVYNKWQKEKHKCDYILNNVKIKKFKKKTYYYIDKETHEVCPFLDKKGLCEIVNNHGEDYLSLTCHMFPRIENVFEDKTEMSLSCSCPEVVELISKINGKINIYSESNIDLKNDLLELKIRDICINIMQMKNYSIDNKLIICFQMLLNIFENADYSEDSILEQLEMYKNDDYIKELIKMFNEIKLDISESLEEINNLFLDIIQNYKEISILETVLKDISSFAEDVEVESLSDEWQEYKIIFEKYDNLMENCITSKILSYCVSNDIKELAISLQMIILEYLLVRYAVFLKYCMNKDKEIDINDLKDYIVAFSRIIGNNTEAVIEFIRDGFGESLLEMGYICFIRA